MKNDISILIADMMVNGATKDELAEVIECGMTIIDLQKKYGTVQSINSSKVSYRNYYGRSSQDKPQVIDNRPPSFSTHYTNKGLNEVLFDTRKDAEDVVEMLLCLIHDYEQVSIADFYNLVGLECCYTDNQYGWTRLSEINIKRVRNGFTITFPQYIKL